MLNKFINLQIDIWQMDNPARSRLASLIDYTLLKPETMEADHLQLCKAAEHHTRDDTQVLVDKVKAIIN